MLITIRRLLDDEVVENHRWPNCFSYLFFIFDLVIEFHLLLEFEYWRMKLVSNKCSEEKDRISLRFFCLSSKKELVIERYRSYPGLGLRGCLLSSTPRLDHLVHIATTIWTASFFLWQKFDSHSCISLLSDNVWPRQYNQRHFRRHWGAHELGFWRCNFSVWRATREARRPRSRRRISLSNMFSTRLQTSRREC